MRPDQTFRNSILSLWQSAIQQVEKNRKSIDLKSSRKNMMSQFVALAQAYSRGEPLPSRDGNGNIIEKCAKLVAQLAWAEITGNEQKMTSVTNELRMSTCDPGWLEALEVYHEFRKNNERIPYIRYKQLDDFIISIPSQAAIGIIADWGTGSEAAEWLLKEVMSHKPDLLIHLGDIYYAGTPMEVKENFLDLMKKHARDVRVYTLSGNHDMYSGGKGYYWLLEQLNQPASYFCLRNNHWQILAMDTGLHDNNPLTVSSNLTYLDPGEASWHLHKMRTAGKRKSILLSHHQLFSSLGVGDDGQGTQIAFNPHLYEVFREVLQEVPLWLWGHEHNLIVFEPYLNLMKGRCVGAGAIPVMVEQNPYEPNPNLDLQGQADPPRMDLKKAKLRTNNSGFYIHSYAIINLNKAEGTISYFQVDAINSAPSELLYSESLGKNRFRR
jgi:hypothetical protein